MQTQKGMAFIVFEGLDGAGKSTLIQSLQKYLQDQGHTVVLTREPGGTPLGEELRGILLRKEGDTPCPKAELLLYEAIRAQHVEKKIAPALAENHWVLCDRFTASSLAFQVGGRQLSREPVDWLNNYATGEVTPRLTVLLDLSTEVSLSRLHGRAQAGAEQELDRFEQEAADFHKRVRHYYLQLAEEQGENWLVLDAEKSPENLFAELLEVLRERKCLN